MDFDIEKIKRKMLVKYPFFGSVVANVSYKENKEIEAAATDGETIYYNSEFLEKLELNEQTFIFAHEVCHIAFDHIRRSEGKVPEVWNIATDGVINQFLKRDGLKIVEGGVNIAEAINYNSEQLYDKLLKEKQQIQRKSVSENLQNQGEKQSQKQETSSLESNITGEQNNDVGHDTHSMWKEAVKKQKDKEKPQSDNEQIEEQKQQGKKLHKEIDKISKMGERKAFKKNLEEKRKELEELKRALAKEAMTAGTSTSSEVREIGTIGRLKPIIDWRYVLRETINYNVDWSYQNAYIENGVISANLEEYPIPETEIVLDTSGSINEILLKNFLRECKNILKQSKVKVGCFDTKFYGFHEVRCEEDIENMEFLGGGGTDFDVAVNAFTRRVENKIIFTDGIAQMPDISLDVIWIVFGNRQINPKGGKVIYITEEQLDRLYSYKKVKIKNI